MKKLACVLGALALGGCEPTELFANSQFDAWCGDKPCGWDADGDVERVGTWHADDYAVELVSDTARIHQLNEIERGFTGCLSFSMLAQVSAEARVFVELDFLDDGVIDWSERLPESDYEALSFNLQPPEWFEGVRIIVRKDGPGLVRIARLRAIAEYASCAGDVIRLTNLPPGAPCEEDEACAGKSCTAGTCDGCEYDRDCDSHEVCGYTELWNGKLGLQCVEPGGRSIGQVCHGDGECGSGVCCENVCSTCCGDALGQCDEGEVCAPAGIDDSTLDDVRPHLCDPGSGRGARDALCVMDSDCASADCSAPDCAGECGVLVTGSYCDRFQYSCEDLGDPMCCWECTAETCRVFELVEGRCQ